MDNFTDFIAARFWKFAFHYANHPILMLAFVGLMLVISCLAIKSYLSKPGARPTMGQRMVLSLLASCVYSIGILLVVQDPDRTFANTLLALTMTIALWSLTFHFVAIRFGRDLSRGALGDFAAKYWVKCIDYLYLLGSSFGIVRLATADATPLGNLVTFNAWGVVVLGIALALRITKTSIEIFGWDRIEASAG